MIGWRHNTINVSEAKSWSVKRLQFEIEILEKEYRENKSEIKDLEDYDDSDGRGAPVGIEICHYNMNSLIKDIELMKNIIREKL